MKRLRLPRIPRPAVDRATVRDPRLLLALVPLVAVLLLMTAGHGARTRPLAAASTSTTSTTLAGGAAPDVAVAGTELVADDGHSSGTYDDGGSSGGAGSGSSGRRSSGSSGSGSSGTGSAARVAGVSESATTVPAVADTTTTTSPASQVPDAVVEEAASPAIMGIVGVGVAALVVNGLVLFRRHRRNEDAT